MSWDQDELIARLDAKCYPDERGCLIWTGAVNSRGYASMGAYGKVMQGHRLAHLLFYGHLHDGPLDHVCTVKRCVNPLHVEQVTTAENNRRAVRKRDGGRVRGGVLHCPQGHAIEGANAKPKKRGGVECRQCHRVAMRDWQKRDRNSAPKFLELAAEIKAIRKDLGWRQQDVADFLGIRSSGQVIVSEWERGRTAISSERLELLRSLIEVAA
jgi:DNA-binding transcriptional regulator YiaG